MGKKTKNLLVANYDASNLDARDTICGGWNRLLFHQERAHPKEPRYYTELDFSGPENVAAAPPLSQHYMPQLLPPTQYSSKTQRKDAGLIGQLPLLIAIAACSAPKRCLEEVLTTSIRPRQWRPHRQPSGRSNYAIAFSDSLLTF